MANKRFIPEDAYPPLLGGVRFQYGYPAVVTARTAMMDKNDPDILARHYAAFWDMVAPMQPKVLTDVECCYAGAGGDLRHGDIMSGGAFGDHLTEMNCEYFRQDVIRAYDIVILPFTYIDDDLLKLARDQQTLIITRRMLGLLSGRPRWIIPNAHDLHIHRYKSLGVTGYRWHDRYSLGIDGGRPGSEHFYIESRNAALTYQPAFFWGP